MPRLKYVDPNPTLFDRQAEQQAARSAKIQAALEKERQIEERRQARKVAQPGKPRGRKWTINRQRIAEVQAVIRLRYAGGSADTDDAEPYLRAVLPQILEDAGGSGSPEYRAWALRWALRWVPKLPQELVRSEIEHVEQEAAMGRPVHRSANELGSLIRLTAEERSTLRLMTIGAMDQTPADRKRDRKAKNAEYQRAKRALNGATPRALSKVQTKPWEAEGVSRTVHYERLKREREAAACPVAETLAEASRTISSALGRRPHLPVTDQSGAGIQTLPGPARTGSPSRIVGAGGHSPRSRPRKDLTEPSGVLLPSEDCVGGHPDLFGAARSALAVQAAPPSALSSVLQAYSDGPLTGDVLQALKAAKHARCRESWADVAREMGMSRQHLANARMGRYGLSPENTAKLKSWLLSA